MSIIIMKKNKSVFIPFPSGDFADETLLQCTLQVQFRTCTIIPLQIPELINLNQSERTTIEQEIKRKIHKLKYNCTT